MVESKNTTDIPSSINGFEKLGINQKFLQTETGRAMARALTLLGIQPDSTLVEDQEGANNTGETQD